MADLTQNAANVNASNLAEIRKEFPAGGTITGGNLVYLDSNNRWVQYDSNAGASIGGNVADKRGIALHNATNLQPLAVAVADPNFGLGATLTNGTTYYGSPNAGAITADVPASGNTPVFVGLAISTTRINLQPVAPGIAV